MDTYIIDYTAQASTAHTLPRQEVSRIAHLSKRRTATSGSRLQDWLDITRACA